MTIRSRLCGALAAATLLGLPLAACQQQAEEQAPASAASGLTDVSGRQVRVHGPVSRIAIDDARYLVALGLIHPDPGSLLVAWPQDVNRLGDETYQQFLQKSPGLATLPKVASSAASFDLESVLAAKPQLALLSLESGVTDAQIAQLEGAGISVAIVDFFVQPMQNLERSLRLLGQVTGRQQQAEAFIAFRKEHMDRIAQGVAKLPADDRPTVFLEAHAGMGGDCCNSPGRGNIGDYLTFVGARNIGADVIQQSFGKLNLEYVISRDPAVYIGTGGPHLAKANGLVLGASVTPAQAQAALRRVTQRPGISGLSAVRQGRAYGFSHQLINSPLDIVAIETFAKWLHPDQFAAVDLAATLDTINRRFLAVPYRGTFWTALPASPQE